MNQLPSWTSQVDLVPQPRMSIRRLFKLFLYFLGAIIGGFGLLGGALTATSSNPIFSNEVGGVAFVFGLLALVGSIFIFFRKGYHIYSLRWIQYLVRILLITVGAVMATVLGLVFFPSPNDKIMSYAIFGCIFFLYGAALIAIIMDPRNCTMEEVGIRYTKA
jgi:hypothetical protein